MPQVNHLNLVDKVGRHYRHERLRNPKLPALVAGGGEVTANGALRVTWPTVDGGAVTYGVTIASVVRLHREAPSTRPKARSNGNGHGAGHATVAGPAETVQAALSTILNVLANVERRANSILKPESRIAAQ